MGQTDSRMAVPSVQCRHAATSTGERCKRYAKPGTTMCSKHGANRDDIKDKAAAMTTLATILDASPKPWPEALAEIIHDFHSLYAHEKTQARSELSSGGAVTADTLTRWVDTGRLTATTILAAERVGILDKAVQLQQQRVSVEGQLISHVVQSVVTPLLDWLNRAGLTSPEQDRDAALAAAEREYGLDSPEYRREMNRSVEYYRDQSELQRLRRWVGETARIAVARLNDWENRDDHEQPVIPRHLENLVLVHRDELAALRDAAARGRARPALDNQRATAADIATLEAELAAALAGSTSDSEHPAGSDESEVIEPTEIIDPDDAEQTKPRPPGAAERHHRDFYPHDVGIGLMGTAATRHFTGR